MKNSIKFTVVFAIISLMVLSAHAQTPSFTISADTTQGDPGDNIVFKFNVDRGDASTYTIERIYVDLDGVHQFAERKGNVSAKKWKGDNFPNNWTATAGFHTMKVTFNWYETTLGKKHMHWTSKIVNIQISGWEKQGGYVHPGLFSSSQELDEVRKNVTTNSIHPMSHAYKVLQKWNFSDLNYDATPLDTVNVKKNHPLGTYHDRKIMDNSGFSVYSHALQWVITKDQRYADKAIHILNSWALTCMATSGNNVGFYGSNTMYRWLEAAEILRYYKINGQGSGWKKTDIQKYNEFVRRIFYPMGMEWEGNIGNPWETQNQPVNMAYARMALGICMDDEAMFLSGYDHFFKEKLKGRKKGYGDWDGNSHTYTDLFGKDPISLYELTIAPNGTFMEINRDDVHMRMCVYSSYKIAELLWHQGIDMYDMKIHNDQKPRLVKGVDWLYTHNNGVPFWSQRRGNEDKAGQVIVRLKQGLGMHEIVYNHYKHRLQDKYAITALNNQTVSRRNGYIKNGKLTMMESVSKNAMFSVLTHADVSKDIQTPIVNNAKSTLTPKLSMIINNSRVLMINYSGWDKNAHVKLYNLAGREIQRVSLAQGTNQIPLKSFSHGLYIVQFQADGYNNIQKFMVR